MKQGDISGERGAVLLTTLLIMSVMAVLAIVMVEDILLAVKRTAHIENEAQANWYLDGADDYVQSYLEGFIAADNPAAANAQLLNGVDALFPLEDGAMSVSIRDGSNCLSLELLHQTEGVEIFMLFFEILGWPTNIAAAQAARMQDWVDSDEIPVPQNGGEDFYYLGLQTPFRTANTAFSSVFELRALDVFEEREFQFLRPFICARKPTAEAGDNLTQLNLNTLTSAQAPLLATALGSPEHIQLAAQLIDGRPVQGWADMETFWASPELEEFDQNDAYGAILMTTIPHHIWVDVTVGYQTLEKRAAFEYRVSQGTVQKRYRYFGDEAHWPRPINLLQGE